MAATLRVARLLARYELAILALAAPFLMFPNRWTGLAIGAIGLCWALRWLSLGRPTVRTYLDVPIIALSATSLVGLWTSIEAPVSLPKFWGIILGIAIYYALINSLQAEKRVHWAAAGLLGFAIGVAVLGFFGTAWEASPIVDMSALYSHIPRFIRGLPGGGTPRILDLFFPREVGAAAGMLLPLALSLAMFGRGWWLRSLAALAMTTLLPILVLSQTLMASVGVVTALIGISLLQGRRSRLVVLAGIATVLIFVIVQSQEVLSWLLVLLAPERRLGSNVWLGRLPLWLWGLFMLRDVPFTGIGLNSFDAALVNLYPDSVWYPPVHAHNFFLQTALDLGVPGLLAFLWLLAAFAYATFVGLRRTSEPNSRAIFLGVAGGVWSYMVFGLLDTFTLGAKPGAAFWAMLGITSALARPSCQPTGTRRPKAWYLRAAIATVVVTLVLMAFLAPGTRGIFYLNIGTVQAHKALAEVRKGGPAPLDLMVQARSNLERAVEMEQYSPHTYLLLGSLNGWLGDCSQSIAFIRKSVMSGGDQPPGAEAIGRWHVLLAEKGKANPVGAGDSDTPVLDRIVHRLAASLGVPRTPETQLERYRAISKTKSWWGPLSTYWEPYLQAGIVLNEEMDRPSQALEVLQEGMARARFTAPLQCYASEIRTASQPASSTR